MVVQITARGQYSGLAIGGDQNARDQFFDRGLARAAGYAYQRDRHPLTPGTGQIGQALQGIRHQQLIAARAFDYMVDHDCGRTLCQRSGSKVVAIKTLTPERHKQIAGLNVAAVGGDAVEGNFFSNEAAASPCRVPVVATAASRKLNIMLAASFAVQRAPLRHRRSDGARR